MKQFNTLDFTIATYRKLLQALAAKDYTFQTFAEFLEKPAPRSIMLRHDVEARYGNALVMAKIQQQEGIKGSYYFRFLPDHFDMEIIREIASLGHEIGYHYDDLSYCHGNYEAALNRFEKNLSILREIAPVKTICMEGAPLSKYDNRDLWCEHQSAKCKVQSAKLSAKLSSKLRDQSLSHVSRNQEDASPTPYALRPAPQASKPPRLHAPRHHYSDFGIIGEPYFDIDFSKVLYLTDTGRRWDGKGSIRDRVQSAKCKVQSVSYECEVQGVSYECEVQGVSYECEVHRKIATLEDHKSLNLTNDQRPTTKDYKFHGTSDIIAAARAGLLPDQIMLTFHPQRWTDSLFPWLRELVMQNVKNVVKRVVVRWS